MTRAVLRATWTPFVLIALLSAIALFGSSTTPVLEQVVTTGFVYLVVVVGLYTFIGLSGVVSFGHISFMGIGAYVCALVSIPPTMKHVLLPALPEWLSGTHFALVPSLLVGGGIALVFALLIAAPIMRISGLAASITMFAVLIVVNVVGVNWDQVTRGTRTMIGTPVTTTLGVAFCAAVLAVVAAWAFQTSSAGLRLTAVREDEFAARSVGISIPRARTYGFALSAFLVGIGGALYAHLQGSFTPADFYLATTFLTIVMLVVGGMHSLTGAVIGTIAVSALQELLNELQEGVDVGIVTIPERPGITQVGLALVLLAILLFRPSGLTGGRELPLPRRWRSSGPRPDNAEPDAAAAADVPIASR
jgi:branched-chain amino acid transport system permease protein